MQTSVTFKNLAPSDPLKQYLTAKLNRLDRYLDNPAEASAVLTVEKHRHAAEISISGDGLTINGKEETSDMYAAIDMALDKIETQIKRSKQKIRSHRGAGRPETGAAGLAEAVEAEEEGILRQVVVKSIEFKPMDVDEAVLQLELLTNAFLVFTNARTGRVNVLYRRKDGHFGLIQPEG